MHLLLFAVILWGTANFLLKYARIDLNTSSVLLAQYAGYAISIVMFRVTLREPINPFPGHLLPYIAGTLTGICGPAGMYFFLHALGFTTLSFASLMSSLYIPVAVALAVIFLGEALSMRLIIGGLLMTIGAMVLGSGQ